MISNSTYLFYLSISKAKSISAIVLSQTIAIVESKDLAEIDYFPNYETPQITINPTSIISSILDVIPSQDNKIFIMVVYDWKILFTNRVNTATIKTRVSDYEKVLINFSKKLGISWIG